MPEPAGWFLVAWSLVAGLGGVGFAVLAAASPLGRIPRKPFVCRTCLSGWGSIGAAALLMHVGGAAAWMDLPCWALLSLAGTGIAHLVLGLADHPLGADGAMMPPGEEVVLDPRDPPV